MKENLICKTTDPIIVRMRENGFNPNRMRPFAERTAGGNFKIWLALSENEVIAAPEGYRLNATLTVDAWKRIDDVVSKVLREELVLFQDVLDRGLTQPLGSQDQALATMFYLYQKASDPGKAYVDMSGKSKHENDIADIDMDGVPLPFNHSEFSLDARYLAASKAGAYGSPIGMYDFETGNIESATRRVAEKYEQMMLDGCSSFTFATFVMYGYLNHPDRIPTTFNKKWNASDKTGEGILKDVRSWKQLLLNKGIKGPFVLYVPKNYSEVLDAPYNQYDARPMLQMIKSIPDIADVKVSMKHADDVFSMVRMVSDTVKIIDGFAPTTIMWANPDGSGQNYKVAGLRAPLIKSSYTKQCGVLHATYSAG